MSYYTFGTVQSVFKRSGHFFAEVHYDSHTQCTLRLQILEALKLNEGDQVKLSVKWNDSGQGQSVKLVRPITLLVHTPSKEVSL